MLIQNPQPSFGPVSEDRYIVGSMANNVFILRNLYDGKTQSVLFLLVFRVTPATKTLLFQNFLESGFLSVFAFLSLLIKREDNHSMDRLELNQDTKTLQIRTCLWRYI